MCVTKNPPIAVLYFVLLIVAQSCNGGSRKTPEQRLKEISKSDDVNIGNSDYHLDLPEGWVRLDTVIQGMELCCLFGPETGKNLQPRMNITSSSMHGKSPKDYVDGTIPVLIRENEGVEILNQGSTYTNVGQCFWYRYNRQQNGQIREAVYYSIPVNGVSYNVTAGVNAGGMKCYKNTFDSIARSFRFTN